MKKLYVLMLLVLIGGMIAGCAPAAPQVVALPRHLLRPRRWTRSSGSRPAAASK